MDALIVVAVALLYNWVGRMVAGWAGNGLGIGIVVGSVAAGKSFVVVVVGIAAVGIVDTSRNA